MMYNTYDISQIKRTNGQKETISDHEVLYVLKCFLSTLYILEYAIPEDWGRNTKFEVTDSHNF